ncbi:erythromycin esterase family protein [Microbacterium sp. SLBN-111]|uniref:erythromycin esterase family protein n=1 Tax=Microbacterium sp. SLBN-111 TaxID=3377733 RepID=UPI003C724C86
MPIDDPVTSWLDAHAHDLRGTDPDGPDDDLEPLLDIVGDARIVAIGESMHRVHEFLDLRHRIFRFLARRAGFTALVIESGFPEGLAVDDWVRNGGTTRLRPLLDRGITYRFGSCQEMLDQVTWMREQNARTPGRPLRFFGMDVPDSSASALPAVLVALALLDVADPAYAAHARSTLLPLFDYLPTDRTGLAQAAPTIRAYLALPESTRLQLSAQLRDLAERLDARRPELVVATGSPEWVDAAIHAARVAVGADAFLAAMSAGPTRTWPPANIRDRVMATTVDGVLDREDRIVVAAANGHVQKTPYSAPPFVPEPLATLGQHLAARWGDDLVVIGTAMGGGSVWLHQPGPEDAEGHSTPFTTALPHPLPVSVDRVLSDARRGNFLVDLRDLPADASDVLAEAPGSLNGFHVQPLDARAAFDAMIVVENVSPWHTWLDAHGLAR